jgi:hypothetical protein
MLPPTMTLQSPVRETKSLLECRPKGDFQPFKPQRRGSLGQQTFDHALFMARSTEAKPIDATMCSDHITSTKLSSVFATDLLKYLDVQHDPMKKSQPAKLQEPDSEILLVQPAVSYSKSEGAFLEDLPKLKSSNLKKMKKKSSDRLSLTDHHGPPRRSSSEDSTLLSSSSSSSRQRKAGRKPSLTTHPDRGRLSRSASVDSLQNEKKKSSKTTKVESKSSLLDRSILKSSALLDAATTKTSSKEGSFLSIKIEKSKSCPSNLASVGLSSCSHRSSSSGKSIKRCISPRRVLSTPTPLETIDEFHSTCFAKQSSKPRNCLRSTRSSNSIYISQENTRSSGGTPMKKRMKRNKSAPLL